LKKYLIQTFLLLVVAVFLGGILEFFNLELDSKSILFPTVFLIVLNKSPRCASEGDLNTKKLAELRAINPIL
jgi:hypothetical protein